MRSIAIVAMDVPERYAKQLLAHLGRGAYTDLPVVDGERRLIGIRAHNPRTAGPRGSGFIWSSSGVLIATRFVKSTLAKT